MTYITIRRPSAITSALLGSCRRGVDRLWARRTLTPEERANLMAGYTPPAIISASLGVHTRTA